MRTLERARERRRWSARTDDAACAPSEGDSVVDGKTQEN